MRSVRIRFRPRKPPEQVVPISAAPDVIQRDDGMFAIGLGDDAAGPFPTMWFALAVAAQQAEAAR